MSLVYYRKYRPTSFSEVTGQHHIVQILKNQVSTNSEAHAYLFTGTRGTGKTTTARLLAKAINCTNFTKELDVCNECVSCISMLNDKAIDIFEIDAASNRGIDDIRSLKEAVNFMPSVLRKKIYIIDEVHMLSDQAFNALLKTLEEPPPYVVFIMATTEPHKVPVTIMSRVQRFDFQSATKENLLQKLNFIIKNENVKVEEGVLDLIYEYTEGSYRDAESLLSKLVNNSEGVVDLAILKNLLGIVSVESFERFTASLLAKDFNSVKDIFNDLVRNSNSIKVLIDQYINFLAKKIFLNVENGTAILDLYQLMDLLIDLKKTLINFNDKKLLVEYTFLKFCSFTKTDDVGFVKNKENFSEELVTKTVLNVVEVKKDSDLDDDLNSILNKINHLDKRAYSILKMSDIVINNGKIIISNSYQFNLSYLSKSEVRDIIEKSYEDIFKSKPLIEFNKNNSTSGRHEDGIKDKETKTKEIYKEEFLKDDDLNEDNSQLIENFFDI